MFFKTALFLSLFIAPAAFGQVAGTGIFVKAKDASGVEGNYELCGQEVSGQLVDGDIGAWGRESKKFRLLKTSNAADPNVLNTKVMVAGTAFHLMQCPTIISDPGPAAAGGGAASVGGGPGPDFPGGPGCGDPAMYNTQVATHGAADPGVSNPLMDNYGKACMDDAQCGTIGTTHEQCVGTMPHALRCNPVSCRCNELLHTIGDNPCD